MLSIRLTEIAHTLANEHELSLEEVLEFHRDDFMGPLRLTTPKKMYRLDAKRECCVFQTTGTSPRMPQQSRHIDCLLVFDLATRPQVLDRSESLYGLLLILWATYFLSKPPVGKEIPWHHDLDHWSLEPVINLSAWIAIECVGRENARVQSIPGSHKRIIPRIPADDDMEFGQLADAAYVDASQALPVELLPDESFLFNEKLLHGSPPNHSERRLRGLAVTLTIPIVRIEHDGPPLHEGRWAIGVRREDRIGFKMLGVLPV